MPRKRTDILHAGFAARLRDLSVLGPLVKDRKTEGDRVFDAARRQGFVRVRVDGEQYDLSEAPTLDKYKRHTIDVVVDRYIVRHADAPDEAVRDAAGRPVFQPRVGPSEWRVSAGLGTVYSTTTVHRRGEEPRDVSLVDLDEGFRMMTTVRGGARIGMRVRVAFDHGVPVFEPA